MLSSDVCLSKCLWENNWCGVVQKKKSRSGPLSVSKKTRIRWLQRRGISRLGTFGCGYAVVGAGTRPVTNPTRVSGCMGSNMATARSYYALVAGASFCLGAGMELFMVRTAVVHVPCRFTSPRPFPLPITSNTPNTSNTSYTSNQRPPQIKTGFYEKVTMIEAEERQTQRERLLSQRGGPGRVE